MGLYKEFTSGKDVNGAEKAIYGRKNPNSILRFFLLNGDQHRFLETPNFDGAE